MIINDVEGDKPTINNNNNDTVSFNINLSEPSEEFKYSVDVVNDGTIDAMLGELIRTGIDSSNQDYIDYTVSYPNGDSVAVNDLLKHGTKVRIIVDVVYKNTTEGVTPAGTGNYSLSLKYIQANDNANPVDTYFESGSNNTFVLNNAKANTLSNLKIYGNTSQAQYSGKNLYNVSDKSSGEGIVDSDDYISITYDNSSSETHMYRFYNTHDLDLESGKIYSIVAEIKSVTGSGHLRIASTYNNYGQFIGGDTSFSDLSANSIIILQQSIRSNYIGDCGLRTHVDFAPGESGSVTFRLSVIEGTGVTTDIFVYEPYVGGYASPNPDYPQDIHTVKNSIDINIKGKNLLNFVNGTTTDKGVTYTVNSDKSVTIDGTNNTSEASMFTLGSVPLESNSTYYFNGMVGPNNYYVECNYRRNGSTMWVSGLISTIESTNAYCYISVRPGKTVNDVTIDVNRFQIEKGNTFTGYVPYQNRNVTLSLGSLELNNIASYKDYIYYKDGDWYVHKEVGSSDVANVSKSDTKTSGIYRWYRALPGADQIDTDMHNKNGALSNVAKLIGNGNTYSFVEGFTVTANKEFIIYHKDWEDKAASVVNQYFSDNRVYCYYKLLNYSDTKITDTTLVNQLNDLITNNLFDGTNYITVSGSDLTPTIEFDYVHE